jgi:2-iminobutanoate/2-iminopropanoate deaminase
LAPYSPAAEAGGLVFLAGQVGLDPKTGERAPDDITAQAQQVMSNIGAVLGDLGLSRRLTGGYLAVFFALQLGISG